MSKKHNTKKSTNKSRERLEQGLFGFTQSNDDIPEDSVFGFIPGFNLPPPDTNDPKQDSQDEPKARDTNVSDPFGRVEKTSNTNSNDGRSCNDINVGNWQYYEYVTGELRAKIEQYPATSCYNADDTLEIIGEFQSALDAIEGPIGDRSDSIKFKMMTDQCTDYVPDMANELINANSEVANKEAKFCCDILGHIVREEINVKINDAITQFEEDWRNRLTIEFGGLTLDQFPEFEQIKNDFIAILNNQQIGGHLSFKSTGMCSHNPQDIVRDFERYTRFLISSFDPIVLDAALIKVGHGGVINDTIQELFLTDLSNLGLDPDIILNAFPFEVNPLLSIGETLMERFVPLFKEIKDYLLDPLKDPKLIIGVVNDLYDLLTPDEKDASVELSLEETMRRYFSQARENKTTTSTYGDFALKEMVNNFFSQKVQEAFDRLKSGRTTSLDEFSVFIENALAEARRDGQILFDAMLKRMQRDVLDNEEVEYQITYINDRPGDEESEANEEEIRQDVRDDNEEDLPDFFEFVPTLLGETLPRSCFPADGSDPFNIFQNSFETFVNGLLHFFGLGNFPEALQLICPGVGVGEEPFPGPRESLINPHYDIPIALESVDCIGEQCEAFPRLRYRVRVIQPGRSLNNYEYSPQMLRRSARLLEGVPVQAYGFGQYQPMLSHLPAELEPMQPSGFALNRVGLLKDAAYENHPDFGEGLFATLIVDKAAEGWAKAILDEATTPGGNGTGVSIFADIDGDYGYDDLNDDMYVKVNNITRFRSVDLASQPAAGGAIVAAIEDAGSQQRKYLNALKEAIKSLTVEEILTARQGYAH